MVSRTRQTASDYSGPDGLIFSGCTAKNQHNHAVKNFPEMLLSSVFLIKFQIHKRQVQHGESPLSITQIHHYTDTDTYRPDRNDLAFIYPSNVLLDFIGLSMVFSRAILTSRFMVYFFSLNNGERRSSFCCQTFLGLLSLSTNSNKMTGLGRVASN